jgi:CRISPR system Cascade subunit CasD
MQSWGTTSRFTQRDTRNEPSKSGVLGLLAAAMGIRRENWVDLEPLTRFSLGVRHDRPGVPRVDYQTAACAQSDTIIRADGGQAKDGVVSERHFLADAAFLVGLGGSDRRLLDQLHQMLRNPVWPLFLGRKSYLPAEPVWIEDGLREENLREALEAYPWLGRGRPWGKVPERLRLSMESEDGKGLMVLDQPLASFAERRFGARFLCSDWIPLPREADHVPS